MNVRADLGGKHLPARYAPVTQRGPCIPSGSILSPNSPFKRSKIAQALIDGLCVVFGLLFLCSVAASLPLAVVIMFLVR